MVSDTEPPGIGVDELAEIIATIRDYSVMDRGDAVQWYDRS